MIPPLTTRLNTALSSGNVITKPELDAALGSRALTAQDRKVLSKMLAAGAFGPVAARSVEGILRDESSFTPAPKPPRPHPPPMPPQPPRPAPTSAPKRTNEEELRYVLDMVRSLGADGLLDGSDAKKLIAEVTPYGYPGRQMLAFAAHRGGAKTDPAADAAFADFFKKTEDPKAEADGQRFSLLMMRIWQTTHSVHDHELDEGEARGICSWFRSSGIDDVERGVIRAQLSMPGVTPGARAVFEAFLRE